LYLKRLSIQGFKSFANRTSFDYGRGVTAVVGPNGSGKSNVSDAIRWVLGEQSVRLLRAKKQEDVIFAGTGSRAQVGMAEVILTLDNEEHWLPVDFAEVEIGRRVYRSGESEYLLNGQRVRLRDVADLLMKGDVGQNSYSIMGQGLVDEVLSMSSDDRRSFLDEAADVKRFRVKVREAQDRLAANTQNTERIGLVIAEMTPRLAQLSRQAERAADHRRLSSELAELLRVSYGHRWSEAHNTLARVRATLDQRSADNAAAVLQVEQFREQIRALGDEIRKRREAIARRDHRNADLERRIAVSRQSIELESDRHRMLVQRHAELEAEAATLAADCAALRAKAPEPDDEAAAEDTAAGSLLETRAQLAAAERDYAEAREALREARDNHEAVASQIRNLARDIADAERRVDTAATDAAHLGAARKQLLGQLASYGRRYAEARATVSMHEGAVESARLAADQARDRLRRVQSDVRDYEAASNEELRELDFLEGRLDALRRVHAEHEDVAAGTRNVLAMGRVLGGGHELPGREIEGVLGLLARQLRVPSGLELAVNAALEQRLHAVIVEDEDVALDAVAALRAQRLGRAQFVPVRALRTLRPVNLQREKGVVGVASKLVRCERRYQEVIDTFLGRVIVVEDLEAARRMMQRGLGAVVTLDGTYIDPSGVITGGATGTEESAFARQRELDELPERIEALRHRAGINAQQLANARLAVEQLQSRVDEAELSYDSLRREVEGAAAALTREIDRLYRLRREMNADRGRRADLSRQQEVGERALAELRTRAAELEAARESTAARLADADQACEVAGERREAALALVAEASAAAAAADGKRRALALLREQHQQAVTRLATEAESRRRRAHDVLVESEEVALRLSALRADLDDALAEQGHPGEDTEADRDELERFENHERRIQDQLADAQANLLGLDRLRLDLESEVRRAEATIADLRLQMDREGFTLDQSGRVLPVSEEAETDPNAVDVAPVIHGAADIDPVAIDARIEDLRRKIRRLGPVNDEAPEDFDELSERHTFLSSQLADLDRAEAQLRAAIAELNEEIRARFTTTFEQVNTSFGEYFGAFFGGGSASLGLTDPENVAESGIEIEAQPPGKRLRSLSLLSGGERSLTAVALLFALLTANPAPFCVLDEVDAALDEANVGRFTSALKELAQKTQFLVVTHNRRTVEIADAIYGVSMMRDGVSKVLSLRIGDLQAD
jgi:chromosome segregation protein